MPKLHTASAKATNAAEKQLKKVLNAAQSEKSVTAHLKSQMRTSYPTHQSYHGNKRLELNNLQSESFSGRNWRLHALTKDTKTGSNQHASASQPPNATYCHIKATNAFEQQGPTFSQHSKTSNACKRTTTAIAHELHHALELPEKQIARTY